MVYIHFPSNLTEEELMLQAKYQKLKKKKKAIQAHKAPKQETDKPIIPKRPSDARDAREVARKLLKSGAIQAIQRPATKQDQTSFKRPKGQERKRVIPDQGVAQYQPFSSTQSDIQSSEISSPEVKDTSTSRVRNLYQQFATERDREERGLIEKKASVETTATPIRTDKPRVGNTIYVSGNKLTDEFLRNHFNAFGDIINISMEIEKGRGFITFAKPESADRAISEMNGKPADGVQLLVQLARRQPQIDLINDASSSAVWSTLAASHSQKGSHKDKRQVVIYDDMLPDSGDIFA
ncbi:hypothetical protein HA402_001782 [Bradysia odoriphaga]|nr:hypothetical protein HA402_001782 [Bradysia odoriphaga]